MPTLTKEAVVVSTVVVYALYVIGVWLVENWVVKRRIKRDTPTGGTITDFMNAEHSTPTPVDVRA